MAVGATNLTLGRFLHDLFYFATMLELISDGKTFITSNVIKIQHHWISLTTVNAWVGG
jgi:hypothetical protein